MTSQSGQTYVTTPGSALLFPSLCYPMGGFPTPEVEPPQDYCGQRSAMMPKRRPTRAKTARIASRPNAGKTGRPATPNANNAKPPTSDPPHPTPTPNHHRSDGRSTVLRGGDGEEAPFAGHALELEEPRSTNSSRDPITRSRSVLDTSTSFGPQGAHPRADARRSADVVPRTSHSPGATRRAPRGQRLHRVADRHRAADRRAGPSNIARKPSPEVLTSRPRNRASCDRTTASCASSNACQSRSPIFAAVCVESTMSVNSTMASTRSSATSRGVR